MINLMIKIILFLLPLLEILEEIDLTDFHNIDANGKIAMKLKEDDKLVNVIICSEKDNIFMSTKLGKCIRFGCKDLRVFSGRSSIGVRG